MRILFTQDKNRSSNQAQFPKRMIQKKPITKIIQTRIKYLQEKTITLMII